MLTPSAAYIVPDQIRKKFVEGWTTHVPLVYLTDKYCAEKNGIATGTIQETLSLDHESGKLTTTIKELSTIGELDLSFDEWHQAWNRLLSLIQEFVPEEHASWNHHFTRIRDSQTRATYWPIWVSYDYEIRHRATRTGIDPTEFHLALWNDLELRITTENIERKLMEKFKPLLKQERQDSRGRHQPAGSSTHNDQQSFRTPHTEGRCIFCGASLAAHLSRNCTSSTLFKSGNLCYLQLRTSDHTRRDKSGRLHCFGWNGKGCRTSSDSASSCVKGLHSCSLCGSSSHNAQSCAL